MLGDISAIATLLLFVIYFIGRGITIYLEKNICYDEIAYVPINARNKYDIVDEVGTPETSDDSLVDFLEMVVLTSKQGIRDIKVLEIAYDDNSNEISDASKIISQCPFLNIGQSFAITTYVPECIPKYRITYFTQDFKKVTLDILENRKSGIVSEMIRPKHTFKSIFYYLFR